MIDRLMEFDAWALHTSASALQDILMLCPPPVIKHKRVVRGVRVAVWLKGQICWRPVPIQFDWEPILLYGGARTAKDRPILRDWVRCNPRSGNRFPGSKPEAVSHYVFEALGARGGDELVDLYPGSGAVTAAWNSWLARSLNLLDH